MEWFEIMWLSLLVGLVIAECFTVNFISIWFACGSLAAFLLALLGVGFFPQLLCFAMVSTVTLIFTRPLARKLTQKRKEPTNADRNIGQTAVCIQRIENALEEGAVQLLGKEWTARTTDGRVVEAGDSVLVENIVGAKLMVSPLSK